MYSRLMSSRCSDQHSKHQLLQDNLATALEQYTAQTTQQVGVAAFESTLQAPKGSLRCVFVSAELPHHQAKPILIRCTTIDTLFIEYNIENIVQ